MHKIHKMGVCELMLVERILLVGCLVLSVLSADPDPLVDFVMRNVNGVSEPPQSFVLKKIFDNGDVTDGPGGKRAGLNTEIFPAIEMQGITSVHFRMKPCGINLPHTHPRATELLTLISGGPLQVGFVDTSGKAHIDILHEGDVTIFPRGLMHFELNVGTKTAFYISSLNSQNPGTLTSGSALFNLPERVLATSLNEELANVKNIDVQYDSMPTLQMSSPSVCTPGKDITIDM